MKTRIVSAVVVLAFAIPLIILGGLPLKIFVMVLSILAFKEIDDLKTSHKILPIIPKILSCCTILLMILLDSKLYTNYLEIILFFEVLSLLIPTIFYKDDKYTTKDALYLIGISSFLGLGFNSLITINSDFYLFIFLLLIPIMTDTFAMLGGSLFKGPKLAEKISPHKTWSGAITGFILGPIIAVFVYFLFTKNIDSLLILKAFYLSIMGQIGDLIFSKIKRENDIKDFSNIMPGHGGVLDRLDSTLIVFMSYMFLELLLHI